MYVSTTNIIYPDTNCCEQRTTGIGRDIIPSVKFSISCIDIELEVYCNDWAYISFTALIYHHKVSITYGYRYCFANNEKCLKNACYSYATNSSSAKVTFVLTCNKSALPRNTLYGNKCFKLILLHINWSTLLSAGKLKNKVILHLEFHFQD